MVKLRINMTTRQYRFSQVNYSWLLVWCIQMVDFPKYEMKIVNQTGFQKQGPLVAHSGGYGPHPHTSLYSTPSVISEYPSCILYATTITCVSGCPALVPGFSGYASLILPCWWFLVVLLARPTGCPGSKYVFNSVSLIRFLLGLDMTGLHVMLNFQLITFWQRVCHCVTVWRWLIYRWLRHIWEVSEGASLSRIV